MAALAMISHVIRAERWRMMLRAAGHKAALSPVFLSLMVGYLVNLVIPRGGEVSRCLNLYRLNQYPVDRSLGTVVAERALDLLCFAAVLVAAFAFEFKRLVRFMHTLPVQWPGFSGQKLWFISGMAVLALAAAGLLVRLRHLQAKAALLKFWNGFLTGLRAAVRIQPMGLFICYTVAIWVLYFFMTQAVLLAFEETRALGYRAVLSVFAIGSLAMVLPLPGGTGSYHTLVPAGLASLYLIPLPEAIAFTFVFHAWQTLIMIAGGVPALIVTGLKNTRSKP